MREQRQRCNRERRPEKMRQFRNSLAISSLLLRQRLLTVGRIFIATDWG
jgi:hypothetical protein